MTFEDLNAWKAARSLVNAIYAATREPALARDFGFVDQIRRASVSVMSNIAEGFERAGIQEKLHFYNIARASAGEVRSLLYILADNYPQLSDHLPPIRATVTEAGRYVSGLIASTHRRRNKQSSL